MIKKKKIILRTKFTKMIGYNPLNKFKGKKFYDFFKKIRLDPKKFKKKAKFLKDYIRSSVYFYKRWKYFRIKRKIELKRLPKNNYKRWCIPVTNWARGALTNQKKLFYYRKSILIKFKKTFIIFK